MQEITGTLKKADLNGPAAGYSIDSFQDDW
jgi:hypothetical protein